MEARPYPVLSPVRDPQPYGRGPPDDRPVRDLGRTRPISPAPAALSGADPRGSAGHGAGPQRGDVAVPAARPA
eukprot:477738-Alexandrium_andersonii.AAC.1